MSHGFRRNREIMTELPAFPEFSRLTIDHYLTVQKYTEQFPLYSDFAFSTLWCWGGEGCHLSDLNGNLVIRLPDYTSPDLFTSFIGRQKVNDTVATLLAAMRESDHLLPYLQAVPEDNLLNLVPDASYQLTEDRNNYDYICDLSLLAKMTGDNYKHFRNKINRFIKDYNWQVRQIDLQKEEIWQEIEKVFVTWSGRTQKETTAIYNALARLKALTGSVGFVAVGLYVADGLVGFMINEPNPSGYVNGVFFHIDTTYVGASAFLYQQAAIILSDKGYRYLNIQPDMGLEGLRRSKQSFHPVFYLRKWRIDRT